MRVPGTSQTGHLHQLLQLLLLLLVVQCHYLGLLHQVVEVSAHEVICALLYALHQRAVSLQVLELGLDGGALLLDELGR